MRVITRNYRLKITVSKDVFGFTWIYNTALISTIRTTRTELNCVKKKLDRRDREGSGIIFSLVLSFLQADVKILTDKPQLMLITGRHLVLRRFLS